MSIRRLFWVREHVESGSGSLNDRRERNYVRRFTVETNDELCLANTVILAPGLPRMWTPFVTPWGDRDLGSWVKEITAERTGSPLIWNVTVNYSSILSRPDINFVENPLLRPAEVSYATQRIAVPMTHDRSGNPVLNSADDPFDPPPERDIKVRVITIVRNQLLYRDELYNGYIDTVNKTPWNVYKAGEVLCEDISAVRAFENGLLFWRVTFRFLARRQVIPKNSKVPKNEFDNVGKLDKSYAWVRWFLDRGFYVKRAGRRELARDVYGQISSTPVLLDGNGAKLALGADPAFRGYHPYPEAEHNDLGLAFGLRR